MSARFVNENGPGVLSGPFLKFLAEEGEITQDALLRARSCGQPTILSRAASRKIGPSLSIRCSSEIIRPFRVSYSSLDGDIGDGFVGSPRDASADSSSS
jgi:hypothetical protein